MKTALPKPSVSEVNHYLEKFQASHYQVESDALEALMAAFPHNQSLSSVLLKTLVINEFYSTQIWKTDIVAKHIFSNNFNLIF